MMRWRSTKDVILSLQEKSHFMRRIAKSKKRSKKTQCLGATSVLRAEHYKAFDVDSKVECIRALIPLGG